MAAESNLGDILDTVYNFQGFGRYRSIRAQQIREEITWLAEIVQSHEPETVMEIGTARGGTLYIWNRFLDSTEKIISVDFSIDEKIIRFFDTFGRTNTIYLREDSQDPETARKIAEEVEEIDFLLVDGDGSYEGVKRDFENYLPLMADDGIIAFHDIGTRPDYEASQVEKFWEEIKAEYETDEYTGKPYKTYKGEPVHLGIGVVYL